MHSPSHHSRESSMAQVRWLHPCPAAHSGDHRPCSGPHDEVTLVDGSGRVFDGCVRHAAATVATVEGIDVQPGARQGAMAETLQQASQRQPYDFSL